MTPTAALVLAGGRSTRMGRDKAALPWNGTTFLARVVATVAEVVDEVVIVARPGQDAAPLPSVAVPCRVAFDEVADRGPLGGIAAGLAALRAPVAYLSACDVPFLAPEFVRAVLEALGDAEVAMPDVGGRLHPLACVCRRVPALAAARALLGAGDLRVTSLFQALRGVRIEAARLRAADPTLGSLENLNTPDDLERARRRLAT